MLGHLTDARAVFLAFLGGLAGVAGCAAVAPNGGMRHSADYVRAHKGEGTRRVLSGCRKIIRDGIAEGWESSGEIDVADEGDGLLATARSVDAAYGVFFYPPDSPTSADVEVLIASPWLKPEQLRRQESQMLDKIAQKLSEKGAAASCAAPAPAAKSPAHPLPSKAKPDKAFDSQL